MGKKYAVDINGDILKWVDGEFECDNKKLLEDVQNAFEDAEDSNELAILLDGSQLYYGKGFNPKDSWLASFAMLQSLMGGRMKFVAGERPTWKDLGLEEDKEAIY